MAASGTPVASRSMSMLSAISPGSGSECSPGAYSLGNTSGPDSPDVIGAPPTPPTGAAGVEAEEAPLPDYTDKIKRTFIQGYDFWAPMVATLALLQQGRLLEIDINCMVYITLRVFVMIMHAAGHENPLQLYSSITSIQNRRACILAGSMDAAADGQAGSDQGASASASASAGTTRKRPAANHASKAAKAAKGAAGAPEGPSGSSRGSGGSRSCDLHELPLLQLLLQALAWASVRWGVARDETGLLQPYDDYRDGTEWTQLQALLVHMVYLAPPWMMSEQHRAKWLEALPELLPTPRADFKRLCWQAQSWPVERARYLGVAQVAPGEAPAAPAAVCFSVPAALLQHDMGAFVRRLVASGHVAIGPSAAASVPGCCSGTDDGPRSGSGSTGDSGGGSSSSNSSSSAIVASAHALMSAAHVYMTPEEWKGVEVSAAEQDWSTLEDHVRMQQQAAEEDAMMPGASVAMDAAAFLQHLPNVGLEPVEHQTLAKGRLHPLVPGLPAREAYSIKVVEAVGQGGQRAVLGLLAYCAKDGKMLVPPMRCVIKVPTQKMLSQEQMLHWERECCVASKTSATGCARPAGDAPPAGDVFVYFAGKLVAKVLFLVLDAHGMPVAPIMEWVHGETLEALLKSHNPDTELGMWHAGRLLGCGALSLFYLDEVHNVMHGDMKPENLVVTPVERLVPAGTDGRVGVVAGGGFVMSNVDTGSAAVLDASITRCPPPVTAEYLAPEAWRGLLRSGRLFTAKVDIWALGVMQEQMVLPGRGSLLHALLHRALDPSEEVAGQYDLRRMRLAHTGEAARRLARLRLAPQVQQSPAKRRALMRVAARCLLPLPERPRAADLLVDPDAGAEAEEVLQLFKLPSLGNAAARLVAGAVAAEQQIQSLLEQVQAADDPQLEAQLLQQVTALLPSSVDALVGTSKAYGQQACLAAGVSASGYPIPRSKPRQRAQQPRPALVAPSPAPGATSAAMLPPDAAPPPVPVPAPSSMPAQAMELQLAGPTVAAPASCVTDANLLMQAALGLGLGRSCAGGDGGSDQAYAQAQAQLCMEDSAHALYATAAPRAQQRAPGDASGAAAPAHGGSDSDVEMSGTAEALPSVPHGSSAASEAMAGMAPPPVQELEVEDSAYALHTQSQVAGVAATAMDAQATGKGSLLVPSSGGSMQAAAMTMLFADQAAAAPSAATRLAGQLGDGGQAMGSEEERMQAPAAGLAGVPAAAAGARAAAGASPSSVPAGRAKRHGRLWFRDKGKAVDIAKEEEKEAKHVNAAVAVLKSLVGHSGNRVHPSSEAPSGEAKLSRAKRVAQKVANKMGLTLQGGHLARFKLVAAAEVQRLGEDLGAITFTF